MTKTFIFIRHGESQSNAGEKTEHPVTVNLTAKGRQQAKDAAEAFNTVPDIIITSKYIRTKQTAEPFLKKLGAVLQEEWDIHEFTFMSSKRYNGGTVQERRPIMEEFWRAADPAAKEDDGESFAEFAARCKTAVEQMRSFKGQTALVFCHGYMITGILFAAQGKFDKVDSQTMRDFWQYHSQNQIGNCEQRVFNIDAANRITMKRTPVKKTPAGPMND